MLASSRQVFFPRFISQLQSLINQFSFQICWFSFRITLRKNGLAVNGDTQEARVKNINSRETNIFRTVKKKNWSFYRVKWPKRSPYDSVNLKAGYQMFLRRTTISSELTFLLQFGNFPGNPGGLVEKTRNSTRTVPRRIFVQKWKLQCSSHTSFKNPQQAIENRFYLEFIQVVVTIRVLFSLLFFSTLIFSLTVERALSRKFVLKMNSSFSVKSCPWTSKRFWLSQLFSLGKPRPKILGRINGVGNWPFACKNLAMIASLTQGGTKAFPIILMMKQNLACDKQVTIQIVTINQLSPQQNVASNSKTVAILFTCGKPFIFPLICMYSRNGTDATIKPKQLHLLNGISSASMWKIGRYFVSS